VGWFFEVGVIQIGKGSARRPNCTTPEEERLRWALYYKKITFEEFERRYKELLKAGKIKRNGRIINE